MFSTAEILRNTNSKSFERGRLIAEKDSSVVARRFADGKSSSDVLACVKSQSGIAESFDTAVVVAPEGDRIVDYACDCPASRKYGVMCKHAVALALTFRGDPESFEGYTESLKPRSSTSVANFLDDIQQGGASHISPESAHISVELSYGFGAWSAQFAVSVADKTYVLSDTGAFADALASGSYLSYGKMLGFVHTIDAFDETSRGIALAIAGAVERLREGGSARQGARPSSPKRTLHLTEQEVARIMDAVGADGFELVDEEHEGRKRAMRVEHGTPPLTVRIVHAGGGTYEILRDDDINIVIGAAHAYVLLDDIAYRCAPSFSPAAYFLKNVYLSPDDRILISPDDIARFCKDVLTIIDGPLRIDAPAELEAYRPREAALAFYLDKAGEGKDEAIQMEVRATYGAHTYMLLAPADGTQRDDGSGAPASAEDAAGRSGAAADAAALAVSAAAASTGTASSERPAAASASCEAQASYRDEQAEGAAIVLAGEYFDASMRIPLNDVDAAGRFLYEGINRLQAMGEVYTTPDFDRLISDKSMRVSIGLSLAGNLINLDVKPTDLTKDELVAVLGAYQRKKRYHRLANGAVASLENVEVAELDRMMQDLGLRASDIAKGDIEIPTYNAFFLDREYADAVRDEAFEDYIHRFDSDASDRYEPPSTVAATLRPYQLEGFRWLSKLADIGFGGILADEMGLGKSLQLITFLLSLKEGGRLDEPALIVCPASLVYNWTEEFAKFAPAMSVCPIDGPACERSRKRRTEGVDVFVASYDSVRQDVDRYESMHFSVVALDEAQFIKNHATKTTRAVKRLQARHRFALTGTPIENRLSEIWSIMDFLMPGFLGSYAMFRRRYEADIIGGDEDAARRLASLVGPFVLRRLKGDVLSELPDKQESLVRVTLEGEQRRLYDALEQKLRNDLLEQRRSAKARRRGIGRTDEGLKVDVLSELMRLRQTALEPSLAYEGYSAGSAKTDAILELVAEAMESGRKALIFSQFTGYLDIIKPELERRGIRYYEITGKTPKRARVDMANDFNANDVPVFLVSLKAGGTGLNLTGASIVIHADPWWNAAAVNQATDRAHRIGQKEMVSVYKVIAKGTIEERIVALQEKKEALADSVVGETSLASLSSLTRAELESLLLDD